MSLSLEELACTRADNERLRDELESLRAQLAAANERAEKAERRADDWSKACLSAREQIEAVTQDRREALNNIERYEAEAYERAAKAFEDRWRLEIHWWGGLATEAPKPLGKTDVGAEIAAAIRALKPEAKP